MSARPPTIAKWLLSLATPRRDREVLLSDLDEEFTEMAEGEARGGGKWWYWRQALTSLLPGLVRRVPGPGGFLPSSLRRDLRFAGRTMRRRPGFALTAVLTIGLGLGASAAVYSIADVTLFRPLPFEDADRIVGLLTTYPGWRGEPSLDDWWDRVELSTAEYERIVDGSSFFESVALYAHMSVEYPPNEAAELLSIGAATSSLASVLGVRLPMGRWFTEEEGKLDDPARVVVLSHEFWAGRLGAPADVLGTSLQLSQQTFTVIGVMPPDFRLRELIDWGERRGTSLWRPRDTGLRPLWLPLGHAGQRAQGNSLDAVARLIDGVTAGQAEEETAALIRGQSSPTVKSGRVVPRTDLESEGLGGQVALLLVPGLLLLIISCSNVTTLFLSECSVRREEFATRLALGAGRLRLRSQLLTESFAISVLSGVVALGVAWLGVDVLRSLAPPAARIQDVGVSGPALGVIVLGIVLTTVLLGLAPFYTVIGKAAGVDPARHGGGEAARAQDGLLTFQIALTVALLVCGSLLTRTLNSLSGVEIGFDANDVVVVQGWPGELPDDQAAEVFVDLVRGLEANPIVVEASGTSSVPFLGGVDQFFFSARSADPESYVGVQRRIVEPDFHRMMEIPLIAGRYLTDADDRTAARVALVSDRLAREMWPNRSPLGASLSSDAGDVFTVVGVVGNIKDRLLDEVGNATVYLSSYQIPRSLPVLLRTQRGATFADVRDLFAAVRSDFEIRDISTMRELVASAAVEQRFNAWLLAVFGVAAAAVAAVGIFGITARIVSHRTRELGIRLALGATGQRLMTGIVAGRSRVALVGISLGLVASLWTSRFLSSFLFGVTAGDVTAFAGVAIGMTLICLGAAYTCARRVLATDPAAVLQVRRGG